MYYYKSSACGTIPSRDLQDTFMHCASSLLVRYPSLQSPTFSNSEGKRQIRKVVLSLIAGNMESANPEKDESPYPTGFKLVVIMASLMLGTTLMALDTTIISVATPAISTQFQALDDVGWYGAAYLMTLTATTPIAANFYKYFNPKYVYVVYICIFEGMATGKIQQ